MQFKHFSNLYLLHRSICSLTLYFLLISSLLYCNENIEQVVILGSGPAGFTAAIYTARAGLKTLIVEGDIPGGQIVSEPYLENFPGFPEGINGSQFYENLRVQALRFGTRIDHGKVTEIDFSKHPFILKLETGKTVLAKAIIIATGTSLKTIGLDSEKTLKGKGVSSCPYCEGFLYRGKEVAVVGGGDNAIEKALYIANYASKVTIIHQEDSLEAKKELQKKVFEHSKIQFIFNTTVSDICDEKCQKVTGLILHNKLTGNKTFFPCSGVFIALGYKPNNELFKNHLEVDQEGFIVTQLPSMCTSIPGVFAAGNITLPSYQQAVTAAGSGCIAGIDAYHFIQNLDSDSDL